MHLMVLLGGPVLGAIEAHFRRCFVSAVWTAEVTVTVGGKQFGPVKTTFGSGLTGIISITELEASKLALTPKR